MIGEKFVWVLSVTSYRKNSDDFVADNVQCSIYPYQRPLRVFRLLESVCCWRETRCTQVGSCSFICGVEASPRGRFSCCRHGLSAHRLNELLLFLGLLLLSGSFPDRDWTTHPHAGRRDSYPLLQRLWIMPFVISLPGAPFRSPCLHSHVDLLVPPPPQLALGFSFL